MVTYLWAWQSIVARSLRIVHVSLSPARNSILFIILENKCSLNNLIKYLIIWQWLFCSFPSVCHCFIKRHYSCKVISLRFIFLIGHLSMRRGLEIWSFYGPFTLSVSDSIEEFLILGHSTACEGNGRFLGEILSKICPFQPVWKVPLIIFSSHFSQTLTLSVNEPLERSDIIL